MPATQSGGGWLLLVGLLVLVACDWPTLRVGVSACQQASSRGTIRWEDGSSAKLAPVSCPSKNRTQPDSNSTSFSGHTGNLLDYQVVLCVAGGVVLLFAVGGVLYWFFGRNKLNRYRYTIITDTHNIQHP